MKLIFNILLAAVVVGAFCGIYTGTKTLTEHLFSVKADTTIVEVDLPIVDEERFIGEWVFMEIDEEEISDTTKYTAFLRNKMELAYVYSGTMRIGIDISSSDDLQIQVPNDSTVIVNLPDVRLLDDKFITHTECFYEGDGLFTNWKPKDEADLRVRAENKMRNRVISEENFRAARLSAIAHYKNLLLCMGFKEDNITINIQGQKLENSTHTLK